jgi:hypothetical protein
MSRLLLLTLVLASAFAVFLVRGLPQAARVERAWSDLREREQALAATRRSVDLVGYDEFLALTARHEQAADQLEKRWATVTEGESAATAPTLATLLEETKLSGLRRPSPLADRLLEDGAASPSASAALVAILRALPDAEGLMVDELELHDAGRPRAVPEQARLQEVEAQLVLTGALADVIDALERLAPERGAGLPVLSVRSAALHRIEPERWGNGVHGLSTPPVRLSATLAILFPTQDSAR